MERRDKNAIKNGFLSFLQILRINENQPSTSPQENATRLCKNLGRLKKQIKAKQTELLQVGADGINGFHRYCLTPDSAVEIKICITLGFINVTEKIRSRNDDIYPIHLAIKSGDSKNVIAVLRNQDINALYNTESGLHILFGAITNDNISPLFEILTDMFQLQNVGIVDLNIRDLNRRTPITVLLEKDFNILSAQNRSKIMNLLFKKGIYINYNLDTLPSIKDLMVRQKEELQKTVEMEGNMRKKIGTSSGSDEYSYLPSTILAACLTGDYTTIKRELPKLKNVLKKNPEPLFAIIVRELCKSKGNRPGFLKCFHLLVRTRYVHHLVDEPDEKRYPAIHYAAAYNEKDIILKLQNISIYLGLDASTKYSLKEINPKHFEEHLNNCIKTNYKHETHPDFRLNFNFHSFNPMGKSDMSVFNFISGNEDLQHLLLHPTISMFLYIHWLRIKPYFIRTLLISCLYFSYSMAYFGLCGGDENQKCIPTPIWLVALGCYVVVLVNSCLFFPRLNLFIRLILYPRMYSYQDQQYFYTICLFLSANELLHCLKGTNLIGLSKHYFLFRRIIRNFIEVLPLYVICIVAFSLAFYKFSTETNTMSITSDVNDETYESNLENFRQPAVSILRTFVMATGEIDIMNMKVEGVNLFYWLLILFIFSISIVLSNLLIALAVKDTQEILVDAKLENIKFRIKIMFHNEEILDNFVENKNRYLELFNDFITIFFSRPKKEVSHPAAESEQLINQRYVDTPIEPYITSKNKSETTQWRYVPNIMSYRISKMQFSKTFTLIMKGKADLNEIDRGSQYHQGRIQELLLYPNRRFSYERETSNIKKILRWVKSCIPVKCKILTRSINIIMYHWFGREISVKEIHFHDGYKYESQTSGATESSKQQRGDRVTKIDIENDENIELDNLFNANMAQVKNSTSDLIWQQRSLSLQNIESPKIKMNEPAGSKRGEHLRSHKKERTNQMVSTKELRHIIQKSLAILSKKEEIDSKDVLQYLQQTVVPEIHHSYTNNWPVVSILNGK